MYVRIRANLSNGGLLLRNTLILKEEETWGEDIEREADNGCDV